MVADGDTMPVTAEIMQPTRFNVNSLGELILNNVVVGEDDMQLTPQQVAFRDKVWKLQEINNADYRVWGSIVDTKEHIRLVTEIRYCTDGDNPVQAWVDGLPVTVPVNGLPGGIQFLPFGTDVMDDSTELDKFGVPIERIEENMERLIGREIVEPSEASQTEGLLWTVGPKHGRPCRQVEIFIDVTSLTSKKQLQAAKDALITMTRMVYREHGVSVL